MAVDYPESYEQVSEKYDKSGFESLAEEERTVYVVWWLEAEVNNGGFHQYFWNSSSDRANEALAEFEKVGAIKTAALLKSAMTIAFGDESPINRSARQALLEINGESKLEKLGKLDMDFYEYNENFYEYINRYRTK